MSNIDDTLQEYLGSDDITKRTEAEIYFCGREGKWPPHWNDLMQPLPEEPTEQAISDLGRRIGGIAYRRFPLNKLAGENLEMAVHRQIDVWRDGAKGQVPKGWKYSITLHAFVWPFKGKYLARMDTTTLTGIFAVVVWGDTKDEALSNLREAMTKATMGKMPAGSEAVEIEVVLEH